MQALMSSYFCAEWGDLSRLKIHFTIYFAFVRNLLFFSRL